MRNMLAFLAAVVLVVGGVGWYLDWYKVASHPIEMPGHRNVSIDINTTKIGTDVQKGEQHLQQWLDTHGAKEAAPVAANKDTKDTKSPTKN